MRLIAKSCLKLVIFGLNFIENVFISNGKRVLTRIESLEAIVADLNIAIHLINLLVLLNLSLYVFL